MSGIEVSDTPDQPKKLDGILNGVNHAGRRGFGTDYPLEVDLDDPSEEILMFVAENVKINPANANSDQYPYPTKRPRTAPVPPGSCGSAGPTGELLSATRGQYPALLT